MEVVSKHAGHASTVMTESVYGWVTSDLAKQQVASIDSALTRPKKSEFEPQLDPSVMLKAMEYAQSSGISLEDVITILSGQNAAKAAE